MQGYWWVWNPKHIKSCNGRVKQSVIVAEKYLKRSLKINEIVHHINGNKLDDRPKNLYVFLGRKEHMSHHFKLPIKKLISNLF